MSGEWKLPWAGGCRCGAVRFQVTQPPLLASVCHCFGCQKMTASAFAATLSLPTEGFEVAEGEVVAGGVQGPEVHHHHCPRCKSWIYTNVEGYDFFVNLRPTLLDDHHWFVPFIEVYTAEKLPWATTPAVHSYETQPEMAEYQQLIAEYAERGGRP